MAEEQESYRHDRRPKPKSATQENLDRHGYRRRNEERQRDKETRDGGMSRDQDHNRDPGRGGQAPPGTNTDGGAQRQYPVPYTRSPVYICKSVTKPEGDGRGDERINRAKDRNHTRNSEPIARHRLRAEGDQYERYVTRGDPLISSHNPDPRAGRDNESQHLPPLSRNAPRRTVHNDLGYEYDDQRPGKYRH
ncbi:uncharacterized protein EAF01_004287 [Botrytis porri]|nr:uncharacterized protein EAF01_004287 [Botrytis porri]KAF7908532.1 hypothetical protein EAF01_004287 [Botrytis porri]